MAFNLMLSAFLSGSINKEFSINLSKKTPMSKKIFCIKMAVFQILRRLSRRSFWFIFLERKRSKVRNNYIKKNAVVNFNDILEVTDKNNFTFICKVRAFNIFDGNITINIEYQDRNRFLNATDKFQRIATVKF